jgi:Transcriptional regulator
MEEALSTELKIKEAARKIFLQKGYAATRIRDISEAAGINLALLNYYYRSKEKLFEEVMMESVQQIFAWATTLANDRTTSLSEKIDDLIAHYIDLILENPNLPVFILSEIQSNPQRFSQKIGLPSGFLNRSYFFEQLTAQAQKAGLSDTGALHSLLNALSMAIFPFAARPLWQRVTEMDDKGFYDFCQERKVLVPAWLKMMLKMDAK